MRNSWILLGLATCFGLPAAAFGPAAHLFIAQRVLDDAAEEALYGAMAADLNGAFRADAEVGRVMQRLTHYEFDRLSPGAFSTGWSTHNGRWGADAIAHAFFSSEAPDDYVTERLRTLSQRAGISMVEAEDLFDAAMELELATHVGTDLGASVAASAASAGVQVEDALVAAFAPALAAQTSLSDPESEERIRWAHRLMKSVLQAYGALLQTERSYQLPIAYVLVAEHFGWTRSEAAERLGIALELARDCPAALDEIAAEIRHHMATEARYADYLIEPVLR